MELPGKINSIGALFLTCLCVLVCKGFDQYRYVVIFLTWNLGTLNLHGLSNSLLLLPEI